MKRIIQLSDLHFGRTDSKVVAALLESINKIQPDVVVISGDLTQRAKPKEFAAARQFLKNIQYPQVIVPGNHDISFYNPWRRFFRPLNHFNKLVLSANNTYIDDEIAVLGINTARSSVLKGGRVNTKQIAEVKKSVSQLSEWVITIAVSHHPMTEIASKQALEQLMDAGVNIFLAGHLHTASAEEIAKSYKDKNFSALLIQAGTATSTRYRGEPNSFNVIEINPRENVKLVIINYSWDSQKQEFIPGLIKSYELKENIWQKLTAEQV